jgi:hypothetical protein
MDGWEAQNALSKPDAGPERQMDGKENPGFGAADDALI